MPPAADVLTSTIALVCYPTIWSASVEVHPRTSPNYDWQAHLRTLCRLARALHEAQPVALRVAGPSEQMLVAALGTVDPEMLILDLVASVASHPGDTLWQDDPLWWCDPSYVPVPEPARTSRQSPHI
jgi:hypothetical protein